MAECFVCEGEIDGTCNYAVPRFEDMIDPSSNGCSDVCERCYYIACALLVEARAKAGGYDKPVGRLEVLTVIAHAPEHALICEALRVHKDHLSARAHEVLRVRDLLSGQRDPKRREEA